MLVSIRSVKVLRLRWRYRSPLSRPSIPDFFRGEMDYIRLIRSPNWVLSLISSLNVFFLRCRTIHQSSGTPFASLVLSCMSHSSAKVDFFYFLCVRPVGLSPEPPKERTAPRAPISFTRLNVQPSAVGVVSSFLSSLCPAVHPPQTSSLRSTSYSLQLHGERPYLFNILPPPPCSSDHEPNLFT